MWHKSGSLKFETSITCLIDHRWFSTRNQIAGRSFWVFSYRKTTHTRRARSHALIISQLIVHQTVSTHSFVSLPPFRTIYLFTFFRSGDELLSNPALWLRGTDLFPSHMLAYRFICRWQTQVKFMEKLEPYFTMRYAVKFFEHHKQKLVFFGLLKLWILLFLRHKNGSVPE